MHSFVLHVFDYFNTIILIYFLVTNVVYTVLMICSLYSVSLQSKQARAEDFNFLLQSPATPPVALIVPAFNEEDAIVQTVLSLTELKHPEKEVIVVDDGSTDETAARLIERFQLVRMDLIYRETLPARRPFAFYHNPKYPNLMLVSKENGGKSDALNVGLNIARSPYFCTVDADSIIENDALLRLLMPVMRSPENTVVSGGVVRISNGCKLRGGRVAEIDLPRSWLERCQILEYMRTFLFGRPGWHFLQATFICSGAFCLLHRETVMLAGGFSTDTVTEDIDMIATLHRFLRSRKWKYRMVFITDPVCWTEAPHTVRMLARQRRRWQLGLVQTVMKHHDMIFSPRFGIMGLFGMPFHAYVEAVGCVVEALGTILIPLSFFVGAMPLSLFLLLMTLAVGYGTMLSMGSVVLHEATLRRFPQIRQVLIISLYAVLENLGYRQMLAFIRAQAVIAYFRGARKWEVVKHKGSATATEAAYAND
jgi:cellulose synthase/poly-beta-1,6-N-acetylglucosamine synthase-like glycosyltransferase